MEEFNQERSMQAAAILGPNPGSGTNQESVPAGHARTSLVAIPLVLVVIYAFIPVLNNGFVLWDDNQNFLENPYFRGLGPAQAKWAWTTFWVGAYQPLSWMLFETQYVFCKLNPGGYHFASVVLEAVNAVVLFHLTLTLLARCRTDSRLESPWICAVSAGIATALFVVHPLRVEAVAWVSCQPYLPCVLFSMLTVLAYLRAFPRDSAPRWGWLIGAFFLFVVALLFKAVPVTLPLVLLILDVYPLQRIPDATDRRFVASSRRVVLEKVPFFMVSLVFMGLAIVAKPQSRLPVEQYGVLFGIARACYATWFYIVKTVLPVDLIAFYPVPKDQNWLRSWFGLSIVATLTMSAGLFLSRRRWPGLLAVWLSYLIILAPNSGLIRISDQIAADRYSYMSMLGLVMLAATGFWWLWRLSWRWHPDAPVGIIAIGLGAILSLTAITRNQCRTWLNSEALWTHALAHGASSSSVVHNYLAVALQAKGDYRGAEAHYNEALRLDPNYADSHNNLGVTLQAQGNFDGAEAHYAEAVRLYPGYADAHNNLGVMLYNRGKHERAEAQFTEALRLNPDYIDARNNLGTILYREKRYAEAEPHFAAAVRLCPDNAQVRYNLGNVLSGLGDYAAAMVQFDRAIRLDPTLTEVYNASANVMATCPDAKFRDGKRAVQFAAKACELTSWTDPSCLNTLAAAQAESGDFDAAVSSQRRALEFETVERRKADGRSRLILYQAKKPYRERSLRLAPPAPRSAW